MTHPPAPNSTLHCTYHTAHLMRYTAEHQYRIATTSHRCLIKHVDAAVVVSASLVAARILARCCRSAKTDRTLGGGACPASLSGVVYTTPPALRAGTAALFFFLHRASKKKKVPPARARLLAALAGSAVLLRRPNGCSNRKETPRPCFRAFGTSARMTEHL